MKTRRYRLGLRDAASFVKPTTIAQYNALVADFNYFEFGDFNFEEGPDITKYIQNKLKTIYEKVDFTAIFECDAGSYYQLINFKGKMIDFIAVDVKEEITEVFTNVCPIFRVIGKNAGYYQVEIKSSSYDKFGKLPHYTILVGGLS